MGDKLYISIVLACRNEKVHIRQTMDGIFEQDLAPGSWELLVADGRSNDGTREILQEYAARYPGQIQVLDNPDQFVASGLNAAIRKAQGEIIVRMDAHTYYASDYVRLCVQELQRTGAANVGGPLLAVGRELWQQAIILAHESPFACGGARFHNPKYEGYVDTVPYGCWKRKTLLDLGLFDESLVRNQDDELNLRLIRSGGKIWQTPKIRAWYTPRNTLQKLFKQYYQYGFWKVAVIRKHRIPASWRHLIPGLVALAGIVVLSVVALSALLTDFHFLTRPALYVLASMSGLYALCLVIASFTAAWPERKRLLPLLPFVFMTYHASYGLGFLAGIIHWPCFGQRQPPSFAVHLTH